MFTKPSWSLAARQGALHRLICLLALVVVASGTQAGAAERLVAADRRAIEATIRQQLEAFDRDDAETAFGYATPDIQRLFGSSDAFLPWFERATSRSTRAAHIQFVGSMRRAGSGCRRFSSSTARAGYGVRCSR